LIKEKATCGASGSDNCAVILLPFEAVI